MPTPETPYRSGALSIAKQGLFSSGGTVTGPVPGEYNSQMNWLDTSRTGNTAHVDHANVFYQIPETASGSPIVYLHGYGQSRMGWQTTPDGREGWSDIFLRYGHAVLALYKLTFLCYATTIKDLKGEVNHGIHHFEQRN